MEDEKTKVLKLCTEFLGNAWSEVALDDIEYEQLFKGLGNKTYRCSINDCVNLSKYKQTEHKEVVVRVYGSDLFVTKDAIKFNGEAGEALIIHILSKIGVAPKLLGVFSGGVILEFIPSRGSNCDDWRDMELCAAFARKLANLHSASVPIAKRPKLLEKGLEVLRGISRDKFDINKYSGEQRRECEFVLSFPIEDEVEWLQNTIPKIRSKVVFSHNDLNPNNILQKLHFDTKDDKLVFVDFEISTYYHRGYDIALFLVAKDVVTQKTENGVVFSVDLHNDGARETILSQYLSVMRELKPNDVDEEVDTVEHLDMEVQFFDLVYRIFVSSLCVAIVYEAKSNLPIWGFFYKILVEYEKKKEDFVRKYPDLISLTSTSAK